MKLTAFRRKMPIFLDVDHEGIYVVLDGAISMSPAEAKALAAALIHYADRAQHIRNAGDSK